MKKDKIFTRNLDGQIIEIGNWEARTSENDAFIGLPLSNSGLKKLRQGRKQGQSDRQIFFDIHHKNAKSSRPLLSVEELTSKQLAKIAQGLLDKELDTLEKMSKEDLVVLVRQLAKLRGTRVGLDLDLDDE